MYKRQLLAWLGGAGRRWAVAYVLLAATAVALYLPWLPIFLRQVGGREGARPPLLPRCV